MTHRRRSAGGPGGEGDPGARDDGLATVWAATAVAVLLGVLAAMLDMAGAVAARHRAEAAADLGALAAAGQAVRGTDVACARAAGVASGTGGRVVLCRLQGWDAVVEVEVAVRSSLLGTVTVRGRARAGPATVDPPDGAVAAVPPTAVPALITPSGRRAQANGRRRRRATTPGSTGGLQRTNGPRGARSP